jgi:hypothetical protein
MELYATSRPVAAAEQLDGPKTSMDTHRDQAIVALSLVVGSWLVAHRLYLFVTT